MYIAINTVNKLVKEFRDGTLFITFNHLLILISVLQFIKVLVSSRIFLKLYLLVGYK